MTRRGAERKPRESVEVVNFSHPLESYHLAQLAAITGRDVARVLDMPAAIRQEEPLAAQTVTLVQSVPYSPRDWQTRPVIVNLPGLAPLAAVVLAELHGMMGHFPAILRLRPESHETVTIYVVAEVINLQSLRDEARTRRSPNPTHIAPDAPNGERQPGDTSRG